MNLTHNITLRNQNFLERDFWYYIGYLLTIARIPIVLFSIFLVGSGSYWTVGVLASLFVILDIFDGFFFRKSKYDENVDSGYRRVLDLCIDRLFTIALLIGLIVFFTAPFLFILLVLLRESVVIAGWIYLRLKHLYIKPNKPSKAACLLGAIIAISYYISSPVDNVFLVFYGCASVYGLFAYYREIKSI